MRVSRCVLFTLVSLTCFVFSRTLDVGARDVHKGPPGKDLPGMEGVLVLDGSNVHNVGELRMHVGNWGLFGSMPGSTSPFSFAPSAEWPAGSGVEYLFSAGLWIGAVRNGIPSVSTAQYETEFRPTQDPIDIIYRASEGAPGGNRLPNPNADDDHDGRIDEDWLNARDDDGDGLVDEDFAAISDQMFSCWYTDNQPSAAQIFPEHDPLDLLVRQESYQWQGGRFDDFVGVNFEITNIGDDVLDDVYIGFFTDFDCGPRERPRYWEDDGMGFARAVECTGLGPVDLEVAYGYDVDGDEGQAPGYLGVLLLDHTTDPLGEKAPEHAGVATYANFLGSQSYAEGGIPTNDFERYEILSAKTIERDALGPRDYGTLIAVGPFPTLEPGETVMFRIAFVAGLGRQGMIENAASTKRLYEGKWFDIDHDHTTGIDRRETPVYGPAHNVVVDACRPELSTPIPFVPEGSSVWVNNDCERENRLKEECGYAEADSALFRTGLEGREHQIHWYLGGEFIQARLDIEPGMCPNRLNVSRGRLDTKNDESMAGGILHVALLGRRAFDVTEVDIASLRLEGVAPVKKPAYHDVGTEPMRERACVCPGKEPDGIVDLVLKFRVRDILAAILPVSDGEERVLTLTGKMMDGRAFSAVDCVQIEKSGDSEHAVSKGQRPLIRSALPNPFNPVTRISYYLPEEAFVTLAVYDVSGRLVDRLVSRVEEAGEHTVEWHASRAPSGVYFCRLEADGDVETMKLVVMK